MAFGTSNFARTPWSYQHRSTASCQSRGPLPEGTDCVYKNASKRPNRSGSKLFNIPSIPVNLSPDATRKLQRKYFWPTIHKAIHCEDPDELKRFWQFTLHSRGKHQVPTPIHPLHKPSREYFPNLPRPVPFHNPDAFPELLPLQKQFRTIRQELERLQENHQAREAKLAPHPNLSYLKGWTSLPLIDNGIMIEHEIFQEKLPVTLELLGNLPQTPRGALFAAQKPMTGIGKHSDGRNFLLTAHLGLHVPKSINIWMEVGGVKRCWNEGDWTILDTSFEHHTWNGTTATRIVLIVDVWHPALTHVERQAILKLYELRGVFLQEWNEMERETQREATRTEQAEKRMFGTWGPKIWS